MIRLGPERDWIAERIARLDEDRSIEYKRSCPWEYLRIRIAKTCMGMANTRNGGTIIIGIRKTNGTYELEGISEEHLGTYDTDVIQAFVNTFADPYATIDLYLKEWDHKEFLGIEVHEFDEFPIVCKRNSEETNKGAIYSRSYRIRETSIVLSQTEMREIIDMATEKGLRKLLRTLHRSGVSLLDITKFTDDEAFKRQRKGAAIWQTTKRTE